MGCRKNLESSNMERKYFAFNKDYTTHSSWLHTQITVPAHQPMLVERLIDEYNYCYLIYHISCETGYSLGYFIENITPQQEIEMWKIVSNHRESQLLYYINSDLRKKPFYSIILRLWKRARKQEELINYLRKVTAHCLEEVNLYIHGTK